jgi:alpha-L-fucosidase
LGKYSKLSDRPVASVEMLGSDVRIRWTQTASGMIIKKPSKFPAWQIPGFKIEFKK